MYWVLSERDCVVIGLGGLYGYPAPVPSSSMYPPRSLPTKVHCTPFISESVVVTVPPAATPPGGLWILISSEAGCAIVVMVFVAVTVELGLRPGHVSV